MFYVETFTGIESKLIDIAISARDPLAKVDLDPCSQIHSIQDKTRQLYLTRVAQSAAKLVSLRALGSVRLTYTHVQ